MGQVLVRDDDGNQANVAASIANAASTAKAAAIGDTVTIGDTTVIEADSGTHYTYVPVCFGPAPSTVKVSVLDVCGAPVETLRIWRGPTGEDAEVSDHHGHDARAHAGRGQDDHNERR